MLDSRNFEVKNRGVRAVFLAKQLDKQVPNCQDFNFYVTLTRSVDWWPDTEIGTCEASTGGASSFAFGDLPPGSYYLTIWRNFDHPYCCLEGDLMVFDEPQSNDAAGCTRRKQLSALDIVHGALDIAGFIPVLGAIPDGVNAAIYAIEGDWANAGLSAVAMVPAWGDGVKLGAVAGKSAIKITEKAAIRLGEEGIVKGLKEVKAASKVEKAAAETTERATKAAAEAEGGLGKEATKAEHRRPELKKEEPKATDKPKKEEPKKEEPKKEEPKKEESKKEEPEKEEPKKEEPEKKRESCASRYPGKKQCTALPLGYIYPSHVAALAVVKARTGQQDAKITSKAPSQRGPCIGEGSHYGVKAGKEYLASLVSCPCCKEIGGHVVLVTLWAIQWH